MCKKIVYGGQIPNLTHSSKLVKSFKVIFTLLDAISKRRLMLPSSMPSLGRNGRDSHSLTLSCDELCPQQEAGSIPSTDYEIS